MTRIKVVGWDADRVLYLGFFTSIYTEYSELDPNPFIEEFIQKGWFSPDDVERWMKEYNHGKSIQRISDVANMLTDFLYKMRRDGKSIITKQQAIEGKQYLLKGLRIEDIVRISSSIEHSPGAEEAIQTFREHGLVQTLYSDSLGPHITYQKLKLGMNSGKGVPPIIELPDRTETEYQDSHLDIPDAKLTGRVLPFKKVNEFFAYLQKLEIPLSDVAVIDDSGANIETLLKPVQESGGLAIGYNPTDAHREKFYRHSIPVLKSFDLRAFAEIVLDPRESVIAKYCE